MKHSGLNQILTTTLGFPRIGKKRELKKATEAYWNGNLSQEELLKDASAIRKENWETQKNAGIELIPSNDFSFYDQVLDMSCLLGVVPERFEWNGSEVDLDLMFLMARGLGSGRLKGKEDFACEMTKWFDTNYHYIVPEFSSNTNFKISSSKPFDEFNEAKALGIQTIPVLIGPMTYLTLGKVFDKKDSNFNRFTLLDRLIPVYEEILKKFEAEGAEWIQIDEPVFTFDLTDEQKEGAKKAFETLSKATVLKLFVPNYFGEARDNRDVYFNLPVEAVHVDLVRGREELDSVLNEIPEEKILSLGVVDGRNIWENDFEDSLSLINKAKKKLGESRIFVSGSCSLMHSPVTLESEEKLDDELKNWLAFAKEKTAEIVTLAKAAEGLDVTSLLDSNKQAIDSRRSSNRIHNQAVKNRVSNIKPDDSKRNSSFSSREKAQQNHLNLPEFPTTTIGSFPQTKEVRQMRAKLKKGELSQENYDKYIAEKIDKLVKLQEEIGIDVLVHGEFERNDMVEYFGEQLEGFAFTKFGWVQSYGSRYVKPPIIFGDVFRSKPMTVRWSEYAQKQTQKPMKGMLTGPVTILQWSFERNDQTKETTAKQIALALRDEVIDLEKAGISVIQIDEPAFREGLPLRRSDWNAYLKWAAEAFRISVSGVKDETQIHTHMCYSEFNDIIESISELDADVISIETSRSQMELLDAFVSFKYPNQIGPGVWDIHSPRVPAEQEMENLLNKAEEVLPRNYIWVNPDCGLKTRQWEEVIPSLKNMVESAKKLRRKAEVATND